MPYTQGDVVLVPFPFTDLSSTKIRPAIVVSNKLVNRSEDVILAQVTTQPINGPLALTITNRDVTTPFKPPHTSMNVYCKKIAVVKKSLIIKGITKLSSRSKLSEILNNISSIFTLD
jgi:mRNA-degrading endonuclease toxin of MazEF toxin-antitoxin module